jgi:hypothetical protein
MTTLFGSCFEIATSAHFPEVRMMSQRPPFTNFGKSWALANP